VRQDNENAGSLAGILILSWQGEKFTPTIRPKGEFVEIFTSELKI